MKYFYYITMAAVLALNVRAAIDVSDSEMVPTSPSRQRSHTATAPASRVPVTSPVLLPVSRPGLIRLRDGDELHGEVLRIDNQGKVEWRFPAAAADLQLASSNVTRILLPGPYNAHLNEGSLQVFLTNGDSLRGEPVGLDGAALTLDTGYAGRLTIPRAHISRLEPVSGPSCLVGPGLATLDGWKQREQPNAWELRDGALIATGTGAVCHDLIWPDRYSVEFDFAWQQLASLRVGLYAGSPDAGLTNNVVESTGFWFEFNSYTVQLARRRPRSEANFGQFRIGSLLHARQAHVELFVDSTSKALSLLLDGQMVRTWVDHDEDFAGKGRCLVFSSRGGGPGIHIDRLTVRPWNGNLNTAVPDAAATNDVLLLTNGDRVTGQFQSLTPKEAAVITETAPLTIPLERITTIYLATNKADRVHAHDSDVVAEFADGNRVTIALDQLDSRTLTSHSENFGKVVFPRNAFRELQFHVNDERCLPITP